MLDSLISSRRNPLVKRLRSLSSRQGRDNEGLLLLEGTHLLQELIRCHLKPVELVATERWCLHHQQLLDDLDGSAPIRLVTEEVLKAALSTITPDGVACLCPLDVLPDPPTDVNFLLVLDRIQDPGNLGTLLRTALAADVQSVWLGSGVDPLGGKSLRASAGALLQLAHQRLRAQKHYVQRCMRELGSLACTYMRSWLKLAASTNLTLRKANVSNGC